MRLSNFITANCQPILDDWVAFAREQQPTASTMDERALLDHGKLILQEIAADMRRPQDDEERQAKSEGHSATVPRICSRSGSPVNSGQESPQYDEHDAMHHKGESK